MGPLPQALCCGILGGPMSGEPLGHSPRRGAASQEALSRCTKQAVPGEAMRGPRRKRQQCTQLAMNLQIRSWLGGFSSHLRLHQGGKGGSSSTKCSFHSTLAHSSSHAGLGGPGEQSLMCPSPEAGRRPCKAVSSSSRLWTQRGPWQSPCGALGPEVEPSKKNCFSPRISSPILQSARVSPSFKRGCLPQSFYRRRSGLLALAACRWGLPFRIQTLGSPRASVPGCLLLPRPVFKRREKPIALSSTESGQLCVHMEVLITPGDSCSRSQGRQVVGDRC